MPELRAGLLGRPLPLLAGVLGHALVVCVILVGRDPDYEIAHLHSTMRPDSGYTT